jgi:hypothetical protein
MILYYLKLLCDAIGRLCAKISLLSDLSFFAFGNLQRKLPCLVHDTLLVQRAELPVLHDNPAVNNLGFHIRPAGCVHQLPMRLN